MYLGNMIVTFEACHLNDFHTIFFILEHAIWDLKPIWRGDIY